MSDLVERTTSLAAPSTDTALAEPHEAKTAPGPLASMALDGELRASLWLIFALLVTLVVVRVGTTILATTLG